MSRHEYTHVYDLDEDGKWLCFFIDRKGAEAWAAAQEGRNLEVTDRRPERPVVADEPSPSNQAVALIDEGLNRAIEAAKEATDE